MTQITVELLGQTVQADLEGCVWERGDQYFVINYEETEYRVEREDIKGEIPTTIRLDTEENRHITGELKCPNCRKETPVDCLYEGTRECSYCNGEYDIRKWKTQTPNRLFEYEFRS